MSRIFIVLISFTLLFISSCSPKHPQVLLKNVEQNNQILPKELSSELTALKVKLDAKNYVCEIQVETNYENKYKKLEPTLEYKKSIVLGLPTSKENFLKNIFDYGYRIKFKFQKKNGGYLNSFTISKDDFSKIKHQFKQSSLKH